MRQADFCPMGGNIMMQAVIMAGGKGTRLAALTKDEIPKPMVPVRCLCQVWRIFLLSNP